LLVILARRRLTVSQEATSEQYNEGLRSEMKQAKKKAKIKEELS